MKTLKEIFREVSTTEEILAFELHDDIIAAHESIVYPECDIDFVECLLNDENGFGTDPQFQQACETFERYQSDDWAAIME